MSPGGALHWLDREWAAVASVLALFAASLLPLLAPVWPGPQLAVYLLLVAYFGHQLEEHLGDRFRRFVNAAIAGGVEALTPRATMVINVGLVWIGYLVVLLLTGLVDPGFGLIAAWSTLGNGVAHVGLAVVRRAGNPGVWTALLLFLPLGAWSVATCSKASGLGAAGQVFGLGVAIATHAGIVAWVRRRRSLLLRQVSRDPRHAS